MATSLEGRTPKRPGYGTEGKPINLWTNYFPLKLSPKILIHRYDIEVVADKKLPQKKKRRVIQLLLEQLDPNIKKATDYGKYLVTLEEMLTNLDFRIVYVFEDEDGPRSNPQTYSVVLQYVNGYPLGDLLSYLQGQTPSYPLKGDVIQMLNILFGFPPKTNALGHSPEMVAVGNKYYPVTGASARYFNLGGGLTAWRGYFMSVRPAATQLLLNIQVKHIAAYQTGPLSTVMLSFLQANESNWETFRQSRKMIKLLEIFVKRVKVGQTHLSKTKGGSFKVKTIQGFATPNDGKLPLGSEGGGSPDLYKVTRWGAGPKEVRFWYAPTGNAAGGLRRDSHVSVFDYFQATYSIALNENLPVINVGIPGKPTYLPADVCQVQPGQPAEAALSADQTRQMIKFAVRRPAENASSIAHDSKKALQLDRNPNVSMTDIQDQVMTVPGRTLQPPQIQYAEGAVNARFGSWNLQGRAFCSGATIDRWSVVTVRDGSNPQRVPFWWANRQPIVEQFIQVLRSTGINVAKEPFLLAKQPLDLKLSTQIEPSGRRAWDVAKIDDFFRDELRKALPGKPKLLLFVLDMADSAVYNKIKRLGDIDYGIHTVCMLGKNYNQIQTDKNLQFFANIALKVNLKLGGTNHRLNKSDLGIVGEGKTMLVGLDVTHPQPGAALNAPSFVGIVASINGNASMYPGELRAQTGKKEMSTDGLKELMARRLDVWYKHNKAYPENIIIYRDGVSEGDYHNVLDQELPEIEKACKEKYSPAQIKNCLPRTTIIIVGKRHHTRFYPTEAGSMSSKSKNCVPGTVVDRLVTEPGNFDCYLQAHEALHGTARPAHYFIIKDEIFSKIKSLVKQPFKNAADVFQDLTHKLCYLFPRATKAISICPPAYCADLLCERARRYHSGVYEPDLGSDTDSNLTGGLGQFRTVIHDEVKDTPFYL